MAAVEFKRNYTLLDAELCMFTSNLCVRLTRDLSDVSVFGINAAAITALKALGDAFEVLPSDDAYLGDLMLATQTKNDIADQIRESIRNMALRLQLKWGANSPQYRTLGDLNVSKVSDDLLLAIASKVLGRMEIYLTDLATTGLVQADLDDFETLIASFEVARNGVTSAVELRDIKSRERIIKGNEIYQFVVNYCEIGKRVYEKTDYAKYNDYIIYTSVSPGSLTPPANLRYNTQYYKVEWDAVENATSYSLEYSTDGVNFTELVSQAETEFSYIPYDAHTWFKCRARNSSGFGEYSDVIQFWYYEPLPAPANFTAQIIMGHQYKLSWELVHSVTSYKIYISDVPFGEPESVFTPLFETSALEYTGSVTPGRRYYFKVTSNNSYQPESAFSNTEYVEVSGGTP